MKMLNESITTDGQMYYYRQNVELGLIEFDVKLDNTIVRYYIIN